MRSGRIGESISLRIDDLVSMYTDENRQRSSYW